MGGSLHRSLGTVIYWITNKQLHCLKAGSVHFCMGKEGVGGRGGGRLLSSSWIKIIFPLQWLITKTEKMEEKWRDVKKISETRKRKREGRGGSWKKTAYTTRGGRLCTLSSYLRSKAHTERGSIKHSSQQGRRCAVTFATSKWMVAGTHEFMQK